MPVLILGDESEEHGANKINAKQALLGNLEREELLEIIKGQKNCLEYRVEKIFDEIDEDNSKTLEIEELRT